MFFFPRLSTLSWMCLNFGLIANHLRSDNTATAADDCKALIFGLLQYFQGFDPFRQVWHAPEREAALRSQHRQQTQLFHPGMITQIAPAAGPGMTFQ